MPSRTPTTEFFDIAIRQADRIVGGRSVDGEERLVSSDKFDSGGARRERRRCLKKRRIDLKCGDCLSSLPAGFVQAHRADEANVITQPSRVNTKIQRGSAQTVGVRKHVPKDFAKGDDTQSPPNL
ncbi:MAG TPA: hypothetical protein VFR05_10020 [Terriglobia bacterium]|nr:hypothetical protein [Terriglobia bacterium]